MPPGQLEEDAASVVGVPPGTVMGKWNSSSAFAWVIFATSSVGTPSNRVLKAACVGTGCPLQVVRLAEDVVDGEVVPVLQADGFLDHAEPHVAPRHGAWQHVC